MAVQTINTGSWQSVVTTTADTAFQNQSQRHMYVITGTTGALTEGHYLAPWQSIVIGSALAVSAHTLEGSGQLFYMVV